MEPVVIETDILRRARKALVFYTNMIATCNTKISESSEIIEKELKKQEIRRQKKEELLKLKDLPKKPRMSKFDREVEEAKERNKVKLAPPPKANPPPPPVTEPEPELEAPPAPEPEAQPAPAPKLEAHPEPEAQPAPEPELEAQPEPESLPVRPPTLSSNPTEEEWKRLVTFEQETKKRDSSDYVKSQEEHVTKEQQAYRKANPSYFEDSETEFGETYTEEEIAEAARQNSERLRKPPTSDLRQQIQNLTNIPPPPPDMPSIVQNTKAKKPVKKVW